MTVACFFGGHAFNARFDVRGSEAVLLCSRCGVARKYVSPYPAPTEPGLNPEVR